MLREKQGFDLISMAEKVGINSSWYWDLEAYDDEVTDTLTLKEVKKLSQILKVPICYILADDEKSINSVNYITPEKLANQVKIHLKTNQMKLEDFEDEAGWYLEWFLKEPNEIMEEPAMFLIDICKALNIEWIRAVPQ